jgi:hypothetical protein
LDPKVAKKLHKLLNTSGYRFLLKEYGVTKEFPNPLVDNTAVCTADSTTADWCLPEVAAADNALNKCKAIQFKPRTLDVKNQYDEGVQHYSFTDKAYNVAATPADVKATETA